MILLPRSSEALSNYATVLSSIRELSPQQGVKLGGDIESLFRASLEVEGSDMHKQDPTPRHLIETEFWKDLNSSSTGNKTINTNKGTVATSKGAVPTKPAASTQSNVPTNKAPIASKKHLYCNVFHISSTHYIYMELQNLRLREFLLH